ncbi:unnamed protein product [Citrullus colocynthis]|uniref:Uncharacterized protein n=1 Tax=Citrullus colocynthis TaxID=252529 RepID=A0ABP0ZAT7_9ROSI
MWTHTGSPSPPHAAIFGRASPVVHTPSRLVGLSTVSNAQTSRTPSPRVVVPAPPIPFQFASDLLPAAVDAPPISLLQLPLAGKFSSFFFYFPLYCTLTDTPISVCLERFEAQVAGNWEPVS